MPSPVRNASTGAVSANGRSLHTGRLPAFQPRDGLESGRREAHRYSSLLHKAQEMEAAHIAFGNGARPDATGVGDLNQRHCFLRAQLDEWTVFQPTLPDRRRSSGANDRPGSGNGVSAGTVACAPWIAMEELRERRSTAVGASPPVNRRAVGPATRTRMNKYLCWLPEPAIACTGTAHIIASDAPPVQAIS